MFSNSFQTGSYILRVTVFAIDTNIIQEAVVMVVISNIIFVVFL